VHAKLSHHQLWLPFPTKRPALQLRPSLNPVNCRPYTNSDPSFSCPYSSRLYYVSLRSTTSSRVCDHGGPFSSTSRSCVCLSYSYQPTCCQIFHNTRPYSYLNNRPRYQPVCFAISALGSYINTSSRSPPSVPDPATSQPAQIAVGSSNVNTNPSSATLLPRRYWPLEVKIYNLGWSSLSRL
jgi:hypothetical protein